MDPNRRGEDQERIGVLMLEGHTEHCAKRQVWGDGECACPAGGPTPGRCTVPSPPEGWTAHIRSRRADIERQAWNLAGCSTYAAGHGLDEGHDAAYALPALNDVRELALKHRKAQEELATLRAERDEARGLLREADLLLAEEQLLAEASPGNMTDEERDRRFEAWFAASRGHIAEFLGLSPLFAAREEPTQ